MASDHARWLGPAGIKPQVHGIIGVVSAHGRRHNPPASAARARLGRFDARAAIAFAAHFAARSNRSRLAAVG